MSTKLHLRAATMDVKITSNGPDAGSAEISAVLGQLRTMIAGIEPTPDFLVVGPKRNRRERRADAARQRTR